MSKIESRSFGTKKAKLYTLQNQNGVKAELTNFGARIVRFWVPVKGTPRNIAFGYASDEEYLAKDTYLGAIVGPVAGRISGGKTVISGTEHHFTQNENSNTLHGGPDSYEVQYWDANADESKNTLTFSMDTEDGFNGFPGPIHIQVTYQLDDANELTISYHATSEKDTLFNPTNHVYFNLDGDPMHPIDRQTLKLNADKYAELNLETLPAGWLSDVSGTAFDFREARPFKQGFISGEAQNKMVSGFDHPWKVSGLSPQAEAWSTAKDLKLEVSTDRSSIVIYTYNGETDSSKGAVCHGAFTMETQELPDACNIEGFGDIILKKGAEYKALTSFKVSFE